MFVADQIKARLAESFSPTRLEVIDESHLHAGHASAPAGGQSHFRVTIVAPDFAGMGRVEAQRLIYRALAAELAGPIHALSIKASAPPDTSS